MKIAIYPGSFDPFTNGHLDILQRARKLFDQVIVLVADNTHKDHLLDIETRVRLIQKLLDQKKGAGARVKVDRWHGLIVDYATKRGANAIIRGLRAASDFEYEFMMAAMNKNLHPKLETVFMMTSQNLFFVSSSMVRELLQYGSDIKPYVPGPVYQALKGQRVER